MQRIDGPTAVAARPNPAAVSGTPGFFTGGDPNVPVAPTTVSPDWLNAVQEEIVGVIIGAGIALSKGNTGQLLAAIQALITSGGVAFATDAEAVAGILATKAVTPHAAAALVVDRISALVANAPATLNTLAELAAAVSNNPNFGSETTAALGARALAARQIQGAGVATGGGDLSNDVTITVADASAVEFNAMADATKVITPAAYGAAGGGDGSTGWSPLPGGNILQWGSLAVIGSNSSKQNFTIAFPKPFLNVCGSVVATSEPYNDSEPSLIANLRAPTTAGVSGTLNTTDGGRKITGARIVRWQAVGK